MSLQPCHTLGSYSVTATIGEGGMGEASRARETRLDRDVVLNWYSQIEEKDEDAYILFAIDLSGKRFPHGLGEQVLAYQTVAEAKSAEWGHLSTLAHTCGDDCGLGTRVR